MTTVKHIEATAARLAGAAGQRAVRFAESAHASVETIRLLGTEAIDLNRPGRDQTKMADGAEHLISGDELLRQGLAMIIEGTRHYQEAAILFGFAERLPPV